MPFCCHDCRRLIDLESLRLLGRLRIECRFLVGLQGPHLVGKYFTLLAVAWLWPRLSYARMLVSMVAKQAD